MSLFGSLRDAKFSEDLKHRFWLFRSWDGDRPKLMLIGLNPSTANARTDDATIRRLYGLAERNGYGGFYMLNLFPYITAYPKELNLQDLTQIQNNDRWLSEKAKKCKDVCFCWGNFEVMGRDDIMKIYFPDALCFGRNKNGSPKHPLYLKGDTKLVKY